MKRLLVCAAVLVGRLAVVVGLLGISMTAPSSDAQNFVWAKRMGGSSSDGGVAMAVDTAGNVYTTGYLNGTADFNPDPNVTYNLTSAGNNDIFVSKLNSNGTFVWAKKMGGTSSDLTYSIAVDSAGNVYTTGQFAGTADFNPDPNVAYNLTSVGDYDIFVSKLDSNGNFVWAKRMGGTSTDAGHAIAVDGAGNVYTTGLFLGTADFNPDPSVTYNLTSAGDYDIFLSKLTSNGSLVWAKRIGGSLTDQSRSIAVDGAGSVYTSGSFDGTADFNPNPSITYNLTSAGSDDIFISKLDSNGNFVWAKRMGGASYEIAESIAVDGANSVYAVGFFTDTVDFNPDPNVTYNLTSAGGDDVFVLKLDSNGSFVWAKRMGGSSTDDGESLAVDGTGNVYTAGQFAGTSDFNPDPIFAFNLTSASGLNDVFVSKLNNSGNFVWARKIGGSQHDWGREIAVDGAGNVYTTGSFSVTADFDPDPIASYNLTSAGVDDVFVAKLGSTPFCNDNDSDGFGAPGQANCPAGFATDCDDTRASVHPGAPENCDGIDNQCPGDPGYLQIDEGLGQTTCGVGACLRTVNTCVGGVLQTCVPGTQSPEICNDGIDNDCDTCTDGMDSDCSSILQVRLDGLEVVQVVQDGVNSVDLVADKLTLVRAYLSPLNATGIPGTVRLRAIQDPAGQNVDLGTRSPDNPGAGFILKANPYERRGEPNGTVYFVLPDPQFNPNNPWVTGTVKFMLEGVGVSLDCGPTPGCSVIKSFVTVPNPEITLVGVEYVDTTDNSSPLTYAAPTSSELTALQQDILTVLPVAGIQWGRMLTTVRAPYHHGTDGFWGAVLSEIKQLRKGELCSPWTGCHRLYLGIVSNYTPGVAETKGKTDSGGLFPASAAYLDRLDSSGQGLLGTYGRNIAAHELGHLLGRPHPALWVNYPIQYRTFCTETEQFPEPHPPDHIYNFGPPLGERPVLGPNMPDRALTAYGVDFGRASGSNRFSVASPFVNFEMMSYCGSPFITGTGVWAWPSIHTYDQLRAAIASRFTLEPPIRSSEVVAQTDYLIASGTIDRLTDTAVLRSPIEIASSLPPPSMPVGPYELRATVGESVVESVLFEPTVPTDTASIDGESAFATFDIPMAGNPAINGFEVRRDGQLIGAMRRSLGVPVVQVVRPNGGEVVDGDNLEVNWTASDPDGDQLSYAVEYSNDSGTSWMNLATSLDVNSLTVPRTKLAGGSHGRIRVSATDGFNSSSDASDGDFIVSKQAPSVVIWSPPSGAHYTRDQIVTLSGSGVDPEDGVLPDTSHEWVSDKDGLLGTGRQIAVSADQLSEGNHMVTLTVTDSDGLTSARQRQISISRAENPINHMPIASAGSDRTLSCTSTLGSAVMLDGSGSRDDDGDPLTYIWTGPFPEGGGLVAGVTPIVTIPLGVNVIGLVVDDAYGGVSVASVSLTVTESMESCDGIDNDCDGIVDNVIPPPAVSKVTLAKTIDGVSQVVWTAVAQATGYDLVRGDLSALRGDGGDFATATDLCLGNDLTSLSVDDADVPTPNEAFWYLTRAVNCGGGGTYDSSDPTQAGPRDTGIGASAAACP